MYFRFASAAALLLPLLTLPASAQNAPPKPAAVAPQAGNPAVTTATFDAFTLRCQTTDKGKLCQVQQLLSVKGQSGPMAQIAIDRLGSAGQLQISVILPNNVSFPSSVKIKVGETDATPLDLAWLRCIPGSCIAHADLTPGALAKLRGATQKGFILFRNAQGQSVSLSTSFSGFSPALDAMAAP